MEQLQTSPITRISSSVIITLDVITSGSITAELPRNLIDSWHVTVI